MLRLTEISSTYQAQHAIYDTGYFFHLSIEDENCRLSKRISDSWFRQK